VSGQCGDQVLYTLTDGRIMYLPPIVKRRIEELRIGRGELFTVTKAEKRNSLAAAVDVAAATERYAVPRVWRRSSPVKTCARSG